MYVNGHIHVPASLTHGKSCQYPFDTTLGGPQFLSGRYLTNSMALVRERTIATVGPTLFGEVSANLCG
jgi:hypothetical protein